MIHVPKREFMGCAVATAAMVAEMSYERVAESSESASPASLRHANRLKKLLENVTGARWIIGFQFLPFSLKKLTFPKWPVALFVQDTRWRPRYGQWVVAKSNLIHDPAYPFPWSRNSYPLRNWYVNHLIKPKDPEELKKIIANKRFEDVLQELSCQIAQLRETPKAVDLHDAIVRK